MAARTLYRSLADVLRSLAFKQSWDNAINSVTKAINECNTNIESYVFLFLSFFWSEFTSMSLTLWLFSLFDISWTKTVDDLTDQQKKATLYGALSIIGALVCFAAAAFFPGALLGAGETFSRPCAKK